MGGEGEGVRGWWRPEWDEEEGGGGGGGGVISLNNPREII